MNQHNHITPPKWPLKFLRFFVKKEYLEEIEGDMEEVFQNNIEKHPIKKARKVYAWEALKLLRPALIKNIEGNYQLNQYGMFKNHLKIALRVFQREKTFTMINVLGLTIGMWCAIMVALWIQDEYQFDRFHENGDHIYQVVTRQQTNEGGTFISETTGYPVGDALMENIPEVRNKTRYGYPESMSVSLADQLTEAKVAAGDPSFFQVFSFPLVKGTPEDCLGDLRNIVISDEMEATYFKGEGATGETFSLLSGGIKIDFTITGIFEKISRRSSLQFDVMLPIDNYLPFQAHPESWGNAWLTTYVLLETDAVGQEVSDKIKNIPKEIGGADMTLELDRFQDRYLAGGHMDQVIIFSIIAALTLLIACFNFINLTTARSGRRSREIGIKKVMGAGKGTLISQFILESGLLVIVSLTLAFLLALVSIPLFSEFVLKDLSLNFSDPTFYGLLLSIGLLTALFSTVYPSAFLASFHAVSALKGRLGKSIGQAILRKGLVIFQFTTAIILMAGALVVYMQLNYLQNKDLGVEKENVIYTPIDGQLRKHYQAVKAELKKHAAIKSVGSSDSDFFGSNGRTSDPTWATKDPGKQLWMGIQAVDFGLAEVLGLQLVQGRFFSEEFATDTLNYMINEQAAEIMGMQDPVGEDLEFWGDQGGKIVGVVQDFHFESLYSPIAPIIIRCRPSQVEWIYFKTEPGKTQEALAHLEKVHDQFSGLPLSYHFLDDKLEKGYKKEIITQKMSGVLSLLAIFIACLGLFGLATYSLQLRTKEVAMRKILGARILHLVRLLFSEYFKLFLMAGVIGIPIAHYLISDWLEDFVYRIDVSLWVYAFPCIIVILVAMFTISKLSVKTASANPIDALHNE